MIDLAQVTLACVDTLHHSLALRALERSRSQIRFGRTLFLTDALPSGIAAPRDIEIERIEPLRSRDDYSRFVLKRLVDHIATSHVLLVQWDGYVINPAAWQSAFLQCDYIGSRWFWFNDGHDVGNGGFSLRSKTLLTALQDPRVELVEAEDITIARHCRDWLERDYGIAFANGALADRFAFEAAYPIGLPFGFHGLFNFCRVMAQDELAALVPHFTDDIVHAPQLAQLLRNCVAMAAWTPAIVIARRMLALDSGNDEARTLLAQSEAASARGFGVGRNDPCPCGSGKRYKQCHGAIAAPTTAQRDTASPDELVRRGIEAQQRGDLGAAESSYRAALARAPEHPHALHYQGMVEYQRGRPAAALPALLHAVELVPSEPEFHNNLGIVCAALDRLADAIAWHRRAIALKPDHAGAWNNLGLALHAQNDPASAVNAFNEALRHAPSFTEARWNLALALLAEGRFAEGWEAYEARQQIAAFAPSAIPSTPRWDGRDARGMRLLLTTEQGLGDAIQFVRFAASLANRGATVFVQTPSTLTNLFRTIEGIANVVEIGAPLPPHDAWLPLMSLGRHLHIDAASLPGPIPYISTNPHRRAAMRSQLARHPGRIRAGLAWAGNPRNNNDRRRSIPLVQLAPLFTLTDIEWFSLQKGDDDDPLARQSLVQLEARNDFDGIAALLDELDVVVSVDTSIVHLAGALAKPVFVLLPFASDWRWRTSRSDSDWYPTAHLFRQPAPGDWASVVSEVAEALRR